MTIQYHFVRSKCEVSAWGHMIQLHQVSLIFQLIYSAEHILFVDVAIKTCVCFSRSDKLEDFIAVEYINSLKLI